MILVEPFAADRHRHVGLVLHIGLDQLDLFAADRAAGLVDRHLRRDHRARAVDVGIEARHVGQHADLDDIVGDLRPGRRERRQHQQNGCK